MKMNKNIFGWIFYDFANSSFTTIIVTVVYSVYFKEVVVGGGEYATALWGWAVSFSMVLVALSSPILGAVADYSRSKKKFLFINCYLCVIFTCLLYFVRAGDVLLGMVFFIIANYGFSCGNVFYNAFLPEISNKTNIGKISGFGWGVGYLGGLVSLLLALMLLKIDVRLVFPMVGAFFGLLSIVTFVLLKEVKMPSKRTNYLKTATRRLSHTFGNIRSYKNLLKFLISYLIYNDGIIVVISFASIYGATQFGMSNSQLIFYFILAQLTSMLGAWVFGYVLDKTGAKTTILITLAIWSVVVVWAFFCRSALEYYGVGLLAGIAIGSSQSSSRVMLARLTPKKRVSEFFGFYSFTGKLTAIFGPVVYGQIAYITGSQRYSILSVLCFFLLGGLILLSVKDPHCQQDSFTADDAR